MSLENLRVVYVNGEKQILERAYFGGDTLLEKGIGLCFNQDYGTATTKEASRSRRVEVPDTTNNRAFAGVTSTSYPAKTGGRWIDLCLPGSVCEIAVGVAAAIQKNNAVRVTCSAGAADAGRFTVAGLAGRGSAIPLQTAGAGVVFALLTGVAVSDADGNQITAAGIGTASEVGDRVFVLCGSMTTSGATIMAAPVETTVATIVGANDITITTALAAAGFSASIAVYVIRGNPRVLAKLEEGEESGLQEFLAIKTAVAPVPMVGGTTFYSGNITIAGDATVVMDDGTDDGMKKAHVLLGALTTKDLLLTATSDIQGDTFTALTNDALDAAGDYCVFEWHGSFGAQALGVWTIISQGGGALT